MTSNKIGHFRIKDGRHVEKHLSSCGFDDFAIIAYYLKSWRKYLRSAPNNYHYTWHIIVFFQDYHLNNIVITLINIITIKVVPAWTRDN